MDKARTGRRLVAASHPIEVGIRYAAALKVAGLIPADITRETGIQSPQLSQWISGRNRPSIDALLLTLPYIDVDLNYLFLGDAGGLPYAKRDALAEAEAQVHAARRRDVRFSACEVHMV
jgi:transcriptional regulator with XRE-family HTH domain